MPIKEIEEVLEEIFHLCKVAKERSKSFVIYSISKNKSSIPGFFKEIEKIISECGFSIVMTFDNDSFKYNISGWEV